MTLVVRPLIVRFIRRSNDPSQTEAWKKLPHPNERVLAGYTIFAGLVVIADTG
jgi:hypothetical protein